MRIWALILLCFLATPAAAQNTGGVFGPVVNAGAESVQYRVTVDVDAGEQFGGTRIAQRVHYQKAVSGDIQLRGVLQLRETATQTVDVDFVQAEAVWQITPDDRKYQTGLRLDVRVRDEDRPDQIGLNWMNQYSWGEGWQARGVLLGAAKFADKLGDDTVGIGGRAQVSKRVAPGVRVGGEIFTLFGDTGRFDFFVKSATTVGPFVSFEIADGVPVFVGTQHGLSNSASDAQFRLWIGRNF